MSNIDFGISETQSISVDSIKKHYYEMLTPLQERFWSRELTCAPMIVGSKYNMNSYDGKSFRLMYVGRAVNGWERDWQRGSIDDLVEQSFKNDFDMSSIAGGVVEDKDGKKYNFNRSPFWQLCKKITDMYGIKDDWSDSLAWSNLYKVAPFETKNPNNKLIKETIEGCANILNSEISYLHPTHIVFVTDAWWYAPVGINEEAFSNSVGVKVTPNTKSIIVGSGISEAFEFSPKVVITKRPESANITREAHAKMIFEEFKALDK